MVWVGHRVDLPIDKESFSKMMCTWVDEKVMKLSVYLRPEAPYIYNNLL